MKHPKARNEFPEQLRPRIEEARRKLKKLNGTLIRDDGVCNHDEETVATPALAPAFPDFPELNLTILRRLSSRERNISPTKQRR
jgi:hypothetical protein